MDDKDNLYFSFDDEKEEPEQAQEVKAEEGKNRSFVAVAVVLGGVFVLVICAAVAYFMFGPQLFGTGATTTEVSGNELTNQVMSTFISMTQTSSFETQTAPTDVPTDTPAPQPSDTPTSAVDTTDVGTQIAEVSGTPGTPGTQPTAGLSGAATTAAPGTGTQTTGTPGTTTPGAGGASGTTTTPTTKPTSSIIEVTPLGQGSTPTQLVSGVGTPGTATSSIIEVTSGQGGGAAAGTPTGQGGPTTPGVTATIPATGFGGGAGLAGAGVLALLLVVVVVVVRKMRLNQ